MKHKSKSIAKMIISAMDSRPETFTLSSLGQNLIDKKTGYHIRNGAFENPCLYKPFFQEFSVFDQIRMERAIKRLRKNQVKDIYEPETEEGK